MYVLYNLLRVVLLLFLAFALAFFFTIKAKIYQVLTVGLGSVILHALSYLSFTSLWGSVDVNSHFVQDIHMLRIKLVIEALVCVLSRAAVLTPQPAFSQRKVSRSGQLEYSCSDCCRHNLVICMSVITGNRAHAHTVF